MSSYLETKQILEGVASFPITPMAQDGAVEAGRLRDHILYQLKHKPVAVFSGCGTGEYHALTADECELVARIAVEATAGVVPVVAAVGQSAAASIELARRLETIGVDGLLVLPPYLIEGVGDGLYEHYAQISAATSLGLIIYHRGNAILDPATAVRVCELPNVIAIKDGLGDLELINRLKLAVNEGILFLNGTSTAEFLAPAYRALGVTSYSSAVFNFLPELSMAFYNALVTQDSNTVARFTREFFGPFVALRREVPGYAVSLVKAGVDIRLGGVGEPRPPLNRVKPEHRLRLERLIEVALELCE